MHSNKKYNCRVCGLKQSDATWGEDGKTASFNICDCCGTEFGYQDATLEAIKNKRKEWLDNGANWNNESRKPEGWSLDEQLKNIPDEYK